MPNTGVRSRYKLSTTPNYLQAKTCQPPRVSSDEDLPITSAVTPITQCHLATYHTTKTTKVSNKELRPVGVSYR
ncbi:hypothetical protein RRG08_024840 [Elysia crispata]|uniref:Uncharacterized protein n=1 Tax=Elysia crispata TaxID=231223 RepID=A0AAE1D0C6_9GAST|nr:hypothetical protein RRG08_024840 [Elysia crispata]